MEKEDIEALIWNLVTLCNQVDLDGVLPYLESQKVFQHRHVEQIQAETTQYKGGQLLVTMLPSRGKESFSKFCEALDIAGQPHLSQLLKSSRMKAELPNGFHEAISYLKDVYLNECEIMKKHWSKLMDYPEDFEMEHMYIDLQIIKEGRRQRDGHDNVNSYPEFFGVKHGQRKYRKIVLEGDPGMGKSTYLHRLVQRWAEGDEWLNKEFSLVFMAWLGEIDSSQSLESMILPEIGDEFTSALMNFARIPSNHKRVLIVLDAFDEMLGGIEKIRKLMEKNNKFDGVPIPNVTVVISTRISLAANKILENCDFRLQTVGFSVGSVIRNFSSKIQKLNYLPQRHRQVELYKNPLFVGMAAKLGYIPDELFDLMTEFCHMTFERYLKVREEHCGAKKNETLIWTEIEEALGMLASKRLPPVLIRAVPLESLDTLQSEELAADVNFNETLKLCLSTGLIWPVKQRKNIGGSNLPLRQFIDDFTFPHQLFLEYFAAVGCKYNGLAKKVRSYHHEFYEDGFNGSVADPYSYFLSGAIEEWKVYLGKNLVHRNEIQCPWIYNVDKFPDIDFSTHSVFSGEYGNGCPDTGKFLNAWIKKHGSRLNRSKAEKASFRYFFFDHNCLAILPLFHNITFLSFSGMILEPGYVSFVFLQWIKCQSLKTIECYGSSDSVLDIILQFLSERNKIQKLSVQHSRLQQRQAISVSNILEQSTVLERFDLISCDVGRCSEVLQALPFRLSELNLRFCKHSDMTVKCLIKYLENNPESLKAFELSGDALIGESTAIFQVLPISLHKLNVMFCSLTADSIKELIRFLEHAMQLKELDVSDNPEVGKIPEFARALFLSPLEMVRIERFDLSNEFIEEFLKIAETKKRGLKNVYVTGREIKNQIQYQKMAKLGYVDGSISYWIKDSGVEYLGNFLYLFRSINGSWFDRKTGQTFNM